MEEESDREILLITNKNALPALRERILKGLGCESMTDKAWEMLVEAVLKIVLSGSTNEQAEAVTVIRTWAKIHSAFRSPHVKDMLTVVLGSTFSERHVEQLRSCIKSPRRRGALNEATM